MAFHITKTQHNGYRCGCCRHEWSDETWVDTLEEALDELPLDMPEESDFGGLYGVEIIDGSTGEKVAWGQMHWSTGYEKYSGYQYTCWSGWHPESGAFEIIRAKDGSDMTGKTWAQVLADMQAAYRAKQVRDAEKNLAEAQAKLTALKE